MPKSAWPTGSLYVDMLVLLCWLHHAGWAPAKTLLRREYGDWADLLSGEEPTTVVTLDWLSAFCGRTDWKAFPADWRTLLPS